MHQRFTAASCYRLAVDTCLAVSSWEASWWLMNVAMSMYVLEPGLMVLSAPVLARQNGAVAWTV